MAGLQDKELGRLFEEGGQVVIVGMKLLIHSSKSMLLMHFTLYVLSLTLMPSDLWHLASGSADADVDAVVLIHSTTSMLMMLLTMMSHH